MKETVETIKKNREDFENSPDTGFMKKSYARVFNLIYCYLFLGLCKLGIFLGIIKPLLCLFIIGMCAFALVFCWLIAGIVTII